MLDQNRAEEAHLDVSAQKKVHVISNTPVGSAARAASIERKTACHQPSSNNVYDGKTSISLVARARISPGTQGALLACYLKTCFRMHKNLPVSSIEGSTSIKSVALTKCGKFSREAKQITFIPGQICLLMNLIVHSSEEHFERVQCKTSLQSKPSKGVDSLFFPVFRTFRISMQRP